jgi:RNA polymerase sigma-70 factor, ECF subfamily
VDTLLLESHVSDTYATAEPQSDFEALLTPLLDGAFGAALHMTRSRPDAEDLVQDAALLAFRAFHTFQPGTNFKAWFFRILVNCFNSSHRRQRGERGLQQLEDATELYIYLHSSELVSTPQESDPIGSTLGRMQSEQVASALHDLPEEYRVVATMYFIEDFSYQDIAAMLGIPIGTVRSRLHRARRMLQKRLWQLAEDAGLIPARRPAADREDGSV